MNLVSRITTFTHSNIHSPTLTYTTKTISTLVKQSQKYSIVGPGTTRLVFEDPKLWNQYDIEPPENLAKLHKKWQERKERERIEQEQDQEEERVAAEEDRNKDIEELNAAWNELQEWWKDPIPQKLKYTYECEAKNIRKCTVTVSSVFGEHYTAPYHPPKDWTCDEAMNCYINEGFGLGGSGSVTGQTPRCVYGPPLNRPEKEKLFTMAGEVKRKGESIEPPESIVQFHDLQDWDPGTPYLKSLSALRKKGAKPDALYTEYLRWKERYANSTAFYFEVADFFFAAKLHEQAVRILSNLMELKICVLMELRWHRKMECVYDNCATPVDDYYYTGTRFVWNEYIRRLMNAGAWDEALRAIQTIKGDNEEDWFYEEARLHDLRARNKLDPVDVQKALALYQKAAFDGGFIEEQLDALLSFHSLAAWTERQNWHGDKPEIPTLGEAWKKTMDADLRIVIEGVDFFDWDELKVTITEPSSEELSEYESFFGADEPEPSSEELSEDESEFDSDDDDNKHVRSANGGYMRHRQYWIKQAQKGDYVVSVTRSELSNQEYFGQKRIMLTVYRNWGRPNQTREVIVTPLIPKKEGDGFQTDESAVIRIPGGK